MTYILGQHGGPIFKGHMPSLDLWRLDHHAVLKHQPPVTQWCSAISQQKRTFNNLLLLLLSHAAKQVSSLCLRWEKLQSLNSKYINIVTDPYKQVHWSKSLTTLPAGWPCNYIPQFLDSLHTQMFSPSIYSYLRFDCIDVTPEPSTEDTAYRESSSS